MNSDIRPIGVFDSGVGGISVLTELVKLMPEENYIYFGDSANAPYGERSYDEVKDLTFHTAEHLLQSGCKCLVIACNTATAAAVKDLRKTYPQIPIIGIEPALKPAVNKEPGGRVLVLATNVTLHEKKFARLLGEYSDKASIDTLACPGIVEFVEKGITDGPELNTYLTDLLHDYIDSPPDALVLGCTHYPFVKDTIRQVLGSDVFIVDGGNGTARETKHQLLIHDLLNQSAESGYVTIENSCPDMVDMCRQLLEKGLQK